MTLEDFNTDNPDDEDYDPTEEQLNPEKEIEIASSVDIRVNSLLEIECTADDYHTVLDIAVDEAEDKSEELQQKLIKEGIEAEIFINHESIRSNLRDEFSRTFENFP